MVTWARPLGVEIVRLGTKPRLGVSCDSELGQGIGRVDPDWTVATVVDFVGAVVSGLAEPNANRFALTVVFAALDRPVGVHHEG